MACFWWWTAFWRKHEPDDVFSYSTLKMVTIRDRYLGLLHYLLQLAILIYIVVFVIFIQKQFLDKEPTIGLVKLGVANPTTKGTATGSRNYCSTPSNQNGFPPCIFPVLDQVTSVSGSTLYITTHINETSLYSDCNVNAPDCFPISLGGEEEFLVANIDDITIMVDHSAQLNFKKKAPLGYLETLEDPDGETFKWKSCSQCTKPNFESLASDYITLTDLLKAAHLDLSANANSYLDGTPDYKGPQNYRNFGSVILLSVVYDNVENFFSNNPPIIYHYRPQLITEVEDRVLESVYTSYPNNRTRIQKRGIRIVGVMAGEIGFFTFQALLIQLTTSVALVKIATTAVDLLAINLLPRRGLYKSAKFEKTKKKKEMQIAQTMNHEDPKYDYLLAQG